MAISKAQILDECIEQHFNPGDLICSFTLSKKSGLPINSCATLLSRRCKEDHLERVARTYKTGKNPFMVYKILPSMIDGFFFYRKSHRAAGDRTGKKLNRNSFPKTVVNL